tara:strand:- start:72 stop:563 length:492 start_codon:yes stop_codon:yes gene_type:complete
MNKIVLLVIISNLFLLSCNTVRDSAGVNRKVIDEYAVVENPPLVIPPNFNLLPPEQMESKNIDDTDSELAKEILFGLDDNNQINSNNSLISEIIKETEADKVDENIRSTINEDFAGEKSSLKDEISFENEEQLNNAIESNKENKNSDKNTKKKEKKKKRFFFF